jgi:glycerophosphoryl diester phosphodiesterase
MSLPAPIKVGHRGAPIFEPQNTLRSFRRAMEMGVDMVEIDLRRTADGALVLAHDAEIRDPDGREWGVADHPFEDLRAVDLGHGERIPTLEETLDLCRGRCALMADLKGEGFEKQMVELLQEKGFTDLVIPGGSLFSRREIRALDPTLPISLSLGPDWKSRINDDLIERIETDAVTWHYTLLDEHRVAQLHEKGLKVFAWTVDSAEEMERLKACEVDGIISNRTDLLTELGVVKN